MRLAQNSSPSCAPHDGSLHYEHLGLPISGEEWRRTAARALDFAPQPGELL